MLVQNLGVEADLFLGGESIQHATDRIHFACNGFGGAALGAFEDHVFQKVGEAVFFRDFAAGAIADPDAYGDGADVRHGLGDDNEAVGKNVPVNVAGVGSHKLLWHRVVEVARMEFSYVFSNVYKYERRGGDGWEGLGDCAG
jgi:hypothetical protein